MFVLDGSHKKPLVFKKLFSTSEADFGQQKGDFSVMV